MLINIFEISILLLFFILRILVYANSTFIKKLHATKDMVVIFKLGVRMWDWSSKPIQCGLCK